MSTSIETILAAFNTANDPEVDLTTENVSLGTPVTVGSSTATFNTRTTISALGSSSPYYGSTVDVLWQRLSLERLFYGIKVTLNVSNAITTTLQLIPYLNDMYDLGLEESDIVSTTLPSGTDGVSVTIRATSTSKHFTDSFQLTMNRGS